MGYTTIRIERSTKRRLRVYRDKCEELHPNIPVSFDDALRLVLDLAEGLEASK